MYIPLANKSCDFREGSNSHFSAMMRFSSSLLLLLVPSVVLGQCPMTSYLEEDHEEYVEEAEGLGWYSDGSINNDAV